MRTYAETHHDGWWILSAKHGLLAPDGPPIDPYDETLINLNTVVDGLRDKGFDTVGEVRDFEDTYRLCYVRGPEGLIVELAEQIGSKGVS